MKKRRSDRLGSPADQHADEARLYGKLFAETSKDARRHMANNNCGLAFIQVVDAGRFSHAWSMSSHHAGEKDVAGQQKVEAEYRKLKGEFGKRCVVPRRK